MTNVISGAFAPVPTPIGSDGEFEPVALRRHLQWIGKSGLDGAVVLGTNGEFPSFTLKERCRVASTAAEAGTDLRLLLGVGSCAVGEAVEMARLAGALGYEAVLLPPPFYFRLAPLRGLADFFRQVLDASPLPVLLYHIPQVTGISISDELLDAIGGHERLVGVKDSSGDTQEMSRLLCRLPGGSYLVGTDRLVAASLEAGGTGSISAAASVVPSLVAAVRRTPDRQPELTTVRSLLEEFGLGPAVKCILRSSGFGSYQTRPPLLGLDKTREGELLKRFAEITGASVDRE